MTEPMDAIMAIHNAFRRDMAGIDAAALAAARGQPGQEQALERYRFFNEILVWHAHGEELAIFPALETVAPLVAEAYIQDHHGLDAAFEAMDAAVAAHDSLATPRASAAFKFHLDIHLAKEDSHVYRLIRQRLPMPEQAKAVGIMAGAVPQERFPEVVAWWFPLIDNDDRENLTRIYQTVMPPPVFAGAKQLIQKALSGDEWAELVRRIPDLA
jgi:hypothetical protein